MQDEKVKEMIRDILQIKSKEAMLQVFDAILDVVEKEKSIHPLLLKMFLEKVKVESELDSLKGLLKIIDVVMKAIMEGESIHQSIVEKLGVILGVKRCVEYLIYPDKNNELGILCELIAGTPEKEHGIGLIEPIDHEEHFHGDLVDVLEHAKVRNIKNPAGDKRTAHFIDTVIREQISNILLIPIILQKQTALKNQEMSIISGIIVIDATHGRMFNDSEVEFATAVGKLIAKLINREERLIGKMRDEIYTRLVVAGSFAERLERDIMKAMTSMGKVKRVAGEFKKDLITAQREFPGGGIFSNHKKTTIIATDKK